MEQTGDQWGLLAIGSSPRWTVDIDGLISGDEWTMEFNGQGFYLLFSLEDLDVVQKALDFLKRGANWTSFEKGNPSAETADRLHLGKFGSSTVSLVWDNEDFVRCFLIVGEQSRSSMFLNLYEEDIKCLIVAFSQALEDLR
jgi:hypothetical protein